jgi:hypothetical protein
MLYPLFFTMFQVEIQVFNALGRANGYPIYKKRLSLPKQPYAIMIDTITVFASLLLLRKLLQYHPP